MAEISRLEITISANGAKETASNLNAVKNALSHLSTAVNAFTAKTSRLDFSGFKKIEQSFGYLNKINTTKLDQLTNSLDALNMVSIAKVVNGLAKLKDIDVTGLYPLADAFKQFANINMTNVNGMVDALDKLSSVNIKRVLKNIKDLNDMVRNQAKKDSWLQGVVDKVNAAPLMLTYTPKEPQYTDFGISDESSGDVPDVERLLRIKKTLLDIKKIAKETGKTLLNMTVGKFWDLIKSVGRVAFYRVIRSAIKAVTDSIRVGVNNLYEWGNVQRTVLGQKFANNLDSISTSFNTLKNSIGAAVAPLINALTPAINAAVTSIINLINSLNMLFSRLSGESRWIKATNEVKKYGAAVGNAKKSLASFDEINNIGGSSGGGSSSGGVYGFTEEDVDVEKTDKMLALFDSIKKAAELIGIAIAAWKLTKFIEGLEISSGLASGLTRIIDGIAGVGMVTIGIMFTLKGIKGIKEDGINPQNFMDVLMGGLGITAGGGFLGKAFGSTGTGLSLGSIFGGGSMFFTGIWSAIKDGINWLNGLLTTSGATLAGTGIAGLLTKLGVTVSVGMGGVVGAAAGAMALLGVYVYNHWDDIKQSWNDGVEYLKETVPQRMDDFKEDMGKVWEDIKSLWSKAGEWITEHFGTDMSNISGVEKSSMENIGIDFSEKLNKIKQNFSEKWKEIKTNWSQALDDLKTKSSEKFNTLKTTFSTKMGELKSTLSTKWEEIKNWWKNLELPSFKIKMPHLSWYTTEADGWTGRILSALGLPTQIPKLSVSWYDVGTNYISEDQLAMVHKGEAIVPAKYNRDPAYQPMNNNETNELLKELISVVIEKDMNTYLDGREIGKASVDYINKQSRLRGANII